MKGAMLDVEHLQAYIRTRGIEAEVIQLPVQTPTVEDAAAAVGTTVDQIVKTLLFLVADQPVLAIASGTAHIDRRPIATHYGVGRKRVKLANPEAVERLTGYPVGAVPPFGARQEFAAIVDPSVFEHPEIFAGGGAMDTLLRIKPAELVRATSAVVLVLRAAPKNPG
jgi:Cys-tRNA(Pro) deacylase